MSWSEQFKIALITKNETRLTELVREMPKFDHLEDMKVAANMLEEARDFFIYRKNQTAKEMASLKKSRNFVETNRKNFSRLDLTS